MLSILFCFHPTIKMVGFPAENHKRLLICPQTYLRCLSILVQSCLIPMILKTLPFVLRLP